MPKATATLVVSAALVLAAPAASSAQSPAGFARSEFWRWALGAVRDEPEARRTAKPSAAGPGPDFCRSGMGHPVHGREWCLEKGFQAGPVPWRRARVGGLVLGETDRPRRRDGRLGPGALTEILGADGVQRLLRRAPVDASESFLNGRWQQQAGPRRARILQIRVADRPLAELNDLDGDGRVDALLLYRGRAR